MEELAESFLRSLCVAVSLFFLSLNCAIGQGAGESPTSLHQLPPGTFEVDSDGKAKEIIDEILQQILGVTSTTWAVWISDDNLDTSNAVSRFYPPPQTKREIVFNKSFLATITRGTDKWPAYCVAAHEIGHIIRLHLENVNLNTADKLKGAELEADYYCGFVLGKMRATYEATVSAIRWYQPSLNYPTRDERIAQIGRGWREATGDTLPVIAVSTNQETPSRSTNEARDDARPSSAPPFAARSAAQPQGPSPPVLPQAQSRALARYSLKDNRDIDGQDLAVEKYGKTGIPGITIQACAERCDKDHLCKAISFDRWNSRCFLKGAIAVSVLDPSSTIGIKAPAKLPNVSLAPAVIQQYNNKRFRDEPIASARFDTFGACRDNCRDNIKCVAFSYLRKARAGETNCQLFKRSDGYYDDQTADSGVKRQASQ